MKRLNFLRLPSFGAMACLATVMAAAPATASEDGSAAAQNGTVSALAAEDRLALLLGQQRGSGEIVPFAASAEAATLPAPAERGLSIASQTTQDYDVLMASLPAAKGDAE